MTTPCGKEREITEIRIHNATMSQKIDNIEKSLIEIKDTAIAEMKIVKTLLNELPDKLDNKYAKKEVVTELKEDFMGLQKMASKVGWALFLAILGLLFWGIQVLIQKGVLSF